MAGQALTARIILEVVGAPKEHVENTLKEIVVKIKKESCILKVVHEDIASAEKVKEFYTTFAELELKIKDSSSLMGLCFDYMPSSIEILEPEEFNSNIAEFTGLVNDLLARLHKYDMLVRNLWAENNVLKKEKEKQKKD